MAIDRIEAQVIANFAWQHMKAACTFRDRVIAIEAANTNSEFGAFFEDIRSYASACIASTASSMEALVNELFIAHNCRLRSLVDNFDHEFWRTGGIERKSILAKYQFALELLEVAPFVESDEPFRSAWAVIEHRNFLVHYKPTWDPHRHRTVNLIEVLNGRFPLSSFPDAGADFVSMKCMSAGCCEWAIASAFALIREFDVRTHLDDDKMAGF
jgi:hypothetical protein